jgi:hypothetical protein
MFRRALPLVLVLGLATSPAILAAPASWSGLLDLLARAGLGVNAKVACSVNPSGQPFCPKQERPKPRRGVLKLGCSIDPNGKMVCTP